MYIVETEMGTEWAHILVTKGQIEILPTELENEKYNTVPSDIQAPPSANTSASTPSEGNDMNYPSRLSQPKASLSIWFRS